MKLTLTAQTFMQNRYKYSVNRLINIYRCSAVTNEGRRAAKSQSNVMLTIKFHAIFYLPDKDHSKKAIWEAARDVY